MAIIDTVRVNDKNTKEVNTKDGKKLVMTYRVFPSDLYIRGIWLPKNVGFGDVVSLYIDGFTKEQNGEYTNFEAPYARASKNFLLSENSPTQAQNNDTGDLFGGSDVDLSDDDLPF